MSAHKFIGMEIQDYTKRTFLMIRRRRSKCEEDRYKFAKLIILIIQITSKKNQKPMEWWKSVSVGDWILVSSTFEGGNLLWKLNNFPVFIFNNPFAMPFSKRRDKLR